jgi:hypothetical protein
MGLVPMYFSMADFSTPKANLGNTLEFAPPPKAILLTKPHYITDSPAYGNGLDFLYVSYYLKVHEKIGILHFVVYTFST